MPNIVLTRIDNRLVHGQVATVVWCHRVPTLFWLPTAKWPKHPASRVDEYGRACLCFHALLDNSKTIENIHKANAKQMIFIGMRESAGCR